MDTIDAYADLERVVYARLLVAERVNTQIITKMYVQCRDQTAETVLVVFTHTNTHTHTHTCLY